MNARVFLLLAGIFYVLVIDYEYRHILLSR